jgi:coenzyme F420-dependent glucose-6-phosphate dehydrogenase
VSTAERVTAGYWLSSEEHGPRALVEHAVQAEAAGFEHAMISDHFHPWTPGQGHAPFVWSVLGAIAHATSALHLATGVTAPILRMHPVVVAHAAATAAVQLEGRFALGLGTGERLNEHVTGAQWPRAAVRRKMLAEAIGIIRKLHDGGDVSVDGSWFTVEHAELYTRPEVPPPIWLAVSGPRSAKLAGEAADGMLSVTADPSLVETFEKAGGEGKPRLGQMHVCWAPDEDSARKTALEWWPNGALPAPLLTELARPAHFAEAAELVTHDAVGASVLCGPDPEPVVRALARFGAAGYTRVYVHQIGPDQRGFFDFWERAVRPLL